MTDLEIVAKYADDLCDSVSVASHEITPSTHGRVTPNDSFDKRCGC